MKIATATMSILDFDGKEIEERAIRLRGADGTITAYVNHSDNGEAKVEFMGHGDDAWPESYVVRNAHVKFVGTALLITGVWKNPETQAVERVRWHLY